MGTTWSLPFGRVAGITIRWHLLFLLYMASELLKALPKGSETLWYVSVYLSTLVVTVILHELGHCFAARKVGGSASEILLWPLGGLAFVDHPQRPYESFVVSAAGPLVNFVLALASGIYLFATKTMPGWIPYGYASVYWVYMVYLVNFWLLAFNLLPGFPLDGGSMLRAALWSSIGYRRATLVTVSVGRLAAIGVGIFAISQSDLLLGFFALYMYMRCEQERILLQEREIDLYGMNSDFGESLWNPREEEVAVRPRKPSIFQRIARWRRRRKPDVRRELTEPEVRRKVDDLLDKINRDGMASLSAEEREFLKEASEFFR